MIDDIKKAIAPYQQRLLEHPLYIHITSPEDLRIFMEHHVYAVWDFMSLLKSLQMGLTSTSIPWKPVGNPEVRYLINEIVLAEETDINMLGERQSHFEMYLDAMHKAGARTQEAIRLVHSDFSKMSYAEAFVAQPKSVAQFLHFTFDTIETKELHKIAAAFTFGREDLIPAMFTAIIEKVQMHFPESDLEAFKYYFDRHIELDEDEHGPMALQMIVQLCDNDAAKWQDVQDTATEALKARITLWDGILSAIQKTR